MNTSNAPFILAGLALLLALPLQVPAQKSATKTTPAVHRPASTRPDAIKLPATIPPAAGTMHAQYTMRYIDIVTGTGTPAGPGMIYSVHYTGWLYDGTKFDSSVDRGEPIEFQQGQRSVIVGWDTGFEGMRAGGKRRLFIPYQLAYGELGKGPIPPKANLIFDVELVDVKDPSAPRH